MEMFFIFFDNADMKEKDDTDRASRFLRTVIMRMQKFITIALRSKEQSKILEENKLKSRKHV